MTSTPEEQLMAILRWHGFATAADMIYRQYNPIYFNATQALHAWQDFPACMQGYPTQIHTTEADWKR